MTFVFVAVFGIGVILILSGMENVSISQTVKDILAGKPYRQSGSGGSGGTGGTGGNGFQSM